MEASTQAPPRSSAGHGQEDGRATARRYRLALFDLDGTLADSFPHFLQTLDVLARRHGFRSARPDEVWLMRQQDARRNMALLGMPRWKLPFVAASFIGLMAQRDRVPLFPGMGETLAHLAAQGVTLGLVTSNSLDNAMRCLGEHGARFTHCHGRASLFGKHRQIRRALRQAGVAPHEAIYIGDQIADLQAAHRAGVDFGAVAWGYGDIDALRRHGPQREFHRVEELRSLAGS